MTHQHRAVADAHREEPREPDHHQGVDACLGDSQHALRCHLPAADLLRDDRCGIKGFSLGALQDPGGESARRRQRRRERHVEPMPAAGQRDSCRAGSERSRNQHGAHAVDEDFRRGLRRIHTMLRPCFHPPQAAPPHGEFQVSSIGLAGPIEIEPVAVVEEGERKLRAPRREVEPLVDARERAVAVLSAALVRSSGVEIAEIASAEAAGAGNEGRRDEAHRKNRGDERRAREPAAIRRQPRDHQQPDRIEGAERHAVDQAARVRGDDKVRGPDQQTGVSASRGNTHCAQNGTSLCHPMSFNGIVLSCDRLDHHRRLPGRDGRRRHLLLPKADQPRSIPARR